MMTLTAWSFTSAARRAPTGTCVVHADRTGITCGGWDLFVDPLKALARQTSQHVVRLPCRVIGRDDQGELRCAPGRPTLDYDATEVLRSFARKEALGVTHLWDAPPVVKRYLRTGDPKLRVAAEVAAWDGARAAAGAIAEGGAWAAARAAAMDTAGVVAYNVAKDAAWVAGEDAAWPDTKSAAWAAAVARQSKRLARMLQAGAH